jgi:hypothetical protein
MWKKIDNHEIIADIKPGDIISTQPERTEMEFRIQKIFIDYLAVTPANGESSMRMFPGDDLISGKWWVKA